MQERDQGLKRKPFKYDTQSDEAQVSQYPKGDILNDYKFEDSQDKYNHLKAIYIFRFPFTVTSIKWGCALGSFFALHTYFKKRSISNSIYWFFAGGIMTGMPIWGFFMLKYSFYTMTLRKFEQEQQMQVDESNILKKYLKDKANIKYEVSDEELLMKKIQQSQLQFQMKHGQLDDLIDEKTMKIFEAELKYKYGCGNIQLQQ